MTAKNANTYPNSSRISIIWHDTSNPIGEPCKNSLQYPYPIFNIFGIDKIVGLVTFDDILIGIHFKRTLFGILWNRVK